MENLSEIIEKQATMNIGLIGHVAHGKSTLVNAISGIKTVRFKSELEKNITIKLGYANTKIYKCDSESCLRPGCYQSFKSSITNTDLRCGRPGCSGNLKLVKHISFVDCPGHDVLMTTMINGAAIMDAAILMIAANEPCPQPQTQEHLLALERSEVEKILIVQNKIDLISRERCLDQFDKINDWLENTKACDSPIVPASGQYKINICAVLDYIVNYFPVSERNSDAPPKMVIVRSFDINKPGFKPDQLNGGVIGGSLLSGKIKVGDLIEIRPGRVLKNENGEFEVYPLFSKITSLMTENTQLEIAYPGGLIGIGTELDPALCIADGLVGNVLGKNGFMPDIYVEIKISYEIFDQVVGVKKMQKVSILNDGEEYLLNVGSCSIVSKLVEFDSEMCYFELTKPVCSDEEEKIAISKNFNNSWRLVGCGKIVSGKKISKIVYEKDSYDFEELKESINE